MSVDGNYLLKKTKVYRRLIVIFIVVLCVCTHNFELIESILYYWISILNVSQKRISILIWLLKIFMIFKILIKNSYIFKLFFPINRKFFNPQNPNLGRSPITKNSKKKEKEKHTMPFLLQLDLHTLNYIYQDSCQ